MNIPKKKLISKGYTPIDILVLHGPGVVLRPTTTAKDFTWWTEYPESGPVLSISGNWLADLADLLNISINTLNGQSARSMTLPLLQADFPDQQPGNDFEITALYGKIDSGVLHLIAFLNDGAAPCCSSHGGNFDVSWFCSIEEVLS